MKNILKKELEKIKISEEDYKLIKKKADNFCKNIKKKLSEKKIRADIFIGGSLAKGTMMKKKEYDIDIFVRFSKEYKDEEISVLLGKVIKGIKIHGSRDYYNVKDENVTFEIIPVIKISKPKEARNVTDLSFFHVSYVQNKIKKNKKLADEILLMKSFCHANNFYGAESYIKGFSGYAVELLMIYYKSFVKFIREAGKAKDKIVLDPEKFYKNRKDILFNLNEAKLSSPIIYIDPTFKERNALAALSQETFQKFIETGQKFLANPSESFFIEKKIDENKYNKIIEITTDKQEGDIAGSKMKKFFEYLTKEAERYFTVSGKQFRYDGKQTSLIYLHVVPKNEIIFNGPRIEDKNNVEKFKKAHKEVYFEDSRIFAKEKINVSFNDFLKKVHKTAESMGITKINLS